MHMGASICSLSKVGVFIRHGFDVDTYSSGKKAIIVCSIGNENTLKEKLHGIPHLNKLAN